MSLGERNTPSHRDRPVFEPANPLFALSTAPGIDHVVLDTPNEFGEQEFLEVDKRIPYPQYIEQFSVVKEVLLPSVPQYETSDKRYLALPSNYVTMGQALNDSIGEKPSANSLEIARSLFAEVGYFATRLATIDKVLPRRIDYKQIILPREEMGILFMPPMNLESIYPDPHKKAEKITVEFLNSCISNSRNKEQEQHIEEAFEGFTETFKVS